MIPIYEKPTLPLIDQMLKRLQYLIRTAITASNAGKYEESVAFTDEAGKVSKTINRLNTLRNSNINLLVSDTEVLMVLRRNKIDTIGQLYSLTDACLKTLFEDSATPVERAFEVLEAMLGTTFPKGYKSGDSVRPLDQESVPSS